MTQPKWDGKQDLMEYAMSLPPGPRSVDNGLRELLEALGGVPRSPTDKSESPLEKRMFEALLGCGFGRAIGDENRFGVLYQQPTVQAKGGTYRLDIGIVRRVGQRVLMVDVEVDGYEFHQRTREQVTSDYRRDHDLAGAGWVVLRYLGAEVWRDADLCALDAAGLVIEMVDRIKGGR